MQYRDDLDGLRAVAVLGVILYHFGLLGITGGFVGVDVFFVLSGYLIGSIVFSQIDNNNFSFSGFYFKRIRRLFPVYVFVLLLTIIVAYGIMLPVDFREFGQSIFASSIYLSNVLFYFEAGYFDSASNLKPLLHTWSLSIEEQFYLIFPLLAWFICRLSRVWTFGIFSVLTLSSLIASVSYIDIDNSAVFYLYPFRAWELFIGVLLATKGLPEAKSKRFNNLMAVLGMLMIMLPYWVYDHSTKFPGLAALLPCVGTLIMIQTGMKNVTLLHRILAIKPLKFIGKISYSLYLWHWPVYVFYTYDNQNEMTMTSALILLLVTFLLSLLSWLYIETPFRKGNIRYFKTRSAVFGVTSIVSMMFLSVGFYIHKTDGMPSRLTEQQLEFANIRLFGDIPNCNEHDNEYYPGIRHCLIGEPQLAESYTLIWGDSHAGAFAQGLIDAFSSSGQNAILAWSGGCPAVFDIAKHESASTNLQDSQCATHNHAIKELIKTQSDKIASVLLIGRWSYYSNGMGHGIDDHNLIEVKSTADNSLNNLLTADRFNALFDATLGAFQQQKLKVFVLEQVPEFTQFESRKYAIQIRNGRMSKQAVIDNFSVDTYDSVLTRQGNVMRFLAQANNKGLATTIGTHQYFCQQNTCSSFINGQPMYFDNNHVSTLGARQLAHIFKPVLEQAKLTGQ